MNFLSPVMVQYQHPNSFLGLPPLVLVLIALFTLSIGTFIGIFIGLATAFIASIILAAVLFISFLKLAKGDRHAERVYLSAFLYWCWNVKAKLNAGGSQ